MIEHLVIGKILCPWGVRGQVKVEPQTDDIRRFKGLSSVYLSRYDQMQLIQIESVSLLKDKFVVIKFEGISSRDQAEELRGSFLEVPRDQAIKLPEGRYFISDIIGLKVQDESGQDLGYVSDVLQYKAHDVYAIMGNDGKEFLIPAVKQVIKGIDLAAGTMTIDVWEGMLE